MTNRELRQLLAESAAELSTNRLNPGHRPGHSGLVRRLLDAEAELYKRAEAGKGNTLGDEAS